MIAAASEPDYDSKIQLFFLFINSLIFVRKEACRRQEREKTLVRVNEEPVIVVNYTLQVDSTNHQAGKTTLLVNYAGRSSLNFLNAL